MSEGRATVLLIEDEPDIRDVISYVLRKSYEVITASDGDEGFRIAKEIRPHIIILDLIMPKMNGIETCKALRSCTSTSDIPIIILSALKSADDRVKAFNSGSDDYISKPFYPDELIARVEAKLRRKHFEPTFPVSAVVCGNLQLNLDKFEAWIDQSQIALTRIEFKIIKYLVENKHKVSSRQEIVAASWKDAVISNRLVDLHIMSLRKKLVGFNHSISSVYGKGYIIKSNPIRSQRKKVENTLFK